MLLYLDNSFLNRPFDNPDISHNRLEGEILFFILELVRKAKVDVVHSAVIAYENSLNPFPERKTFIDGLLKYAKAYQNLNEHIEQRAKILAEEMRLPAIDALHLATAEHAGVDFFITCDYTIIKKYKGKMRIATPLDFLTYYGRSNN